MDELHEERNDEPTRFPVGSASWSTRDIPVPEHLLDEDSAGALTKQERSSRRRDLQRTAYEQARQQVQNASSRDGIVTLHALRNRAEQLAGQAGPIRRELKYRRTVRDLVWEALSDTPPLVIGLERESLPADASGRWWWEAVMVPAEDDDVLTAVRFRVGTYELIRAGLPKDYEEATCDVPMEESPTTRLTRQMHRELFEFSLLPESSYNGDADPREIARLSDERVRQQLSAYVHAAEFDQEPLKRLEVVQMRLKAYENALSDEYGPVVLRSPLPPEQPSATSATRLAAPTRKNDKWGPLAPFLAEAMRNRPDANRTDLAREFANVCRRSQEARDHCEQHGLDVMGIHPDTLTRLKGRAAKHL